MCYNFAFPRIRLKGRYDISLSLSLSVSRAHTSPITLSSQLVSNNAFIHSNAPSVGYQTDQFSSARPRMQRNISPIAYYSKADPVFFPRFELFTNVQIFILFEPGNVLSRIIRRARSSLNRANLMHYLFVIFQPARQNSFILERQILIIFSITTITILVVLTLNSYYVFLKKIVETDGNSI